MTQKKTQASVNKKATKASSARKASKAEFKSVEIPKTNGKKAENKTSVSRANGVTEKKSAPIVFSLDDVEALVASRGEQAPEESTEPKPKRPAPVKKTIVEADAPTEKRVLGAASLADILGFNPADKKKDTGLNEDDVPKKWKRYYDLLIKLRHHVRDELDLHTADTLKHSSRDDSGDLSNYGNHQADAGTDAFDRDFALSLVSSEQEALNEVEEAIRRIKDGTYGVCEVTGQPISKERLEAVPFARFSVEGQAEYEKNKRRRVDRSTGGLFGDTSDAPKLASDDDEE